LATLGELHPSPFRGEIHTRIVPRVPPKTLSRLLPPMKRGADGRPSLVVSARNFDHTYLHAYKTQNRNHRCCDRWFRRTEETTQRSYCGTSKYASPRRGRRRRRWAGETTPDVFRGPRENCGRSKEEMGSQKAIWSRLVHRIYPREARGQDRADEYWCQGLRQEPATHPKKCSRGSYSRPDKAKASREWRQVLSKVAHR